MTTCRSERRRLYRKDIAARLLSGARSRARRNGIPFSITKADIVVPQYCPILGLPLEVGVGAMQDNSPTLDRIKPERGYVPGNVVVVSNRANRLKSDGSIEELLKIASFYQQLTE